MGVFFLPSRLHGCRCVALAGCGSGREAPTWADNVPDIILHSPHPCGSCRQLEQCRSNCRGLRGVLSTPQPEKGFQQ